MRTEAVLNELDRTICAVVKHWFSIPFYIRRYAENHPQKDLEIARLQWKIVQAQRQPHRAQEILRS
ncbi:hypothetical protein ACUN0C_19045 [Faunimonas sp. B44]|uniref:hypothetical protein n=1 Tax=Faunimonas sp. B44 TaxID=3461493 RepID=UPI004043D668